MAIWYWENTNDPLVKVQSPHQIRVWNSVVISTSLCAITNKTLSNFNTVPQMCRAFVSKKHINGMIFSHLKIQVLQQTLGQYEIQGETMRWLYTCGFLHLTQVCGLYIRFRWWLSTLCQSKLYNPADLTDPNTPNCPLTTDSHTPNQSVGCVFTVPFTDVTQLMIRCDMVREILCRLCISNIEVAAVS